MAPTFTTCAHFLGVHGTAIRSPLCTDRCTGPLCEVLIHVIPDWPISDHMNRCKQDVTSDIIAYYV
ncbi:unnamed protein product [Staurois parvus]|uniref:Uncharacterized protein n=1 Tax=Staurois parvus TaxID=386267 RepID=A0ABN9B001_9NEOB|nr:unnamed protein product [Staurois parvus]